MELIDRMRVNGEIYGALNAGQITSDTYAVLLERIESIENAPVRCGKWIYAGGIVKCSACEYEYIGYIECDTFCGNCGAKMDADK